MTNMIQPTLAEFLVPVVTFLTDSHIFTLIMLTGCLGIGWMLWENYKNDKSTLREQYYAVRDLLRVIDGAQKVYGSDNSNKPIKKTHYLTLLDAFDRLQTVASIPAESEIDFRKNMPAGGWRGLKSAPDMKSRIADVREYLKTNDVFGPAGYEIIQNIKACLNYVGTNVNVEAILGDAVLIMKIVANGELR